MKGWTLERGSDGCGGCQTDSSRLSCVAALWLSCCKTCIYEALECIIVDKITHCIGCIYTCSEDYRNIASQGKRKSRVLLKLKNLVKERAPVSFSYISKCLTSIFFGYIIKQRPILYSKECQLLYKIWSIRQYSIRFSFFISKGEIYRGMERTWRKKMFFERSHKIFHCGFRSSLAEC